MQGPVWPGLLGATEGRRAETRQGRKAGMRCWEVMGQGCWLLPQPEGNAPSRVRSLSLGGVGRGGKAGEISWGSQSLLSGWGLQIWGCHHYKSFISF